MNPDEVVIDEMQSNRTRVVLGLLAEPVGQPGEPAYVPPNREVLVFNE
jgi:hypothetical protein